MGTHGWGACCYYAFLFGNTDMPQIMPQLEKLQKQTE